MRRALIVCLALGVIPSGSARAAAPTGGAPYGDAPTPTQPDRPAQPAGAAPAPGVAGPAPGAATVPGQRAALNRDGTASAPAGAAPVVAAVIAAANRIATLPYRYGGGHRSFDDTAYDCSGSVSYALHGGNLLASPLASGGLETWGSPGPGRWITVYANAGHAFMFVAGLRFDTSGQRQAGTRWQDAPRSLAGFVVRHPAGL